MSSFVSRIIRSHEAIPDDSAWSRLRKKLLTIYYLIEDAYYRGKTIRIGAKPPFCRAKTTGNPVGYSNSTVIRRIRKHKENQ